MPTLGPEGKQLKALANKISVLQAEQVTLNTELRAEEIALDRQVRAQDASGFSKLKAGLKKAKDATTAMVSNLKKDDTNDWSNELAAAEKSKSKEDRMKFITDHIESIEQKSADIKAAESELKTLLKTHQANEQQAKKFLIQELKEYLEPLRESADPKEVKRIEEELDKCLKDNQDQAYPYEKTREAVAKLIRNSKEPLQKGMEEIVGKWKPTKDDPDTVLANVAAYKTRDNRKIADQIETCITNLEKHINKNEKRYKDVPNAVSIIIQSMQFEKNKYLTKNERQAETRPANKSTLEQWECALKAIAHKGAKGELKCYIEVIPLPKAMEQKLNKVLEIKPEKIMADYKSIINKHKVEQTQEQEVTATATVRSY